MKKRTISPKRKKDLDLLYRTVVMRQKNILKILLIFFIIVFLACISLLYFSLESQKQILDNNLGEIYSIPGNVNLSMTILYMSAAGSLIIIIIIILIYLKKKKQGINKKNQYIERTYRAKEFIMKAKDKGYNDIEIRNLFLARGWKIEEIKDIFKNLEY